MRHRKFTAIVYHYIRDFEHSLFPKIHGLSVGDFEKQLDYLQENYEIISLADIISAIDNNKDLPRRCVLLTFNDNLADHYKNVFPILMARGLKGIFYSEAEAIKQERILQPHKIHHILASAPDLEDIEQRIREILGKKGTSIPLDNYKFDFIDKTDEHYFDDNKSMIIKRLLQFGLARSTREEVADRLFDRYVGIDQQVFSKDFYMNLDQIRMMIRHGMSFGIIGSTHQWLAALSRQDQLSEISGSIKILKAAGMNPNQLTVSYPFGSYNEDTLEILQSFRCRLGFTGTIDIADLDSNHHLELPRLDTNDVPKYRYASQNEWYFMAG